MPIRRDFLKTAASTLAGSALITVGARPAEATKTTPLSNDSLLHDVRKYGATGDGTTIDTAAINAAISAVAEAGGGTVFFPSGTYASYSIHLKSNVALYLDQGATLLAASVPLEGTTTGGYDAAEPQGPFEPYQDYGHNHWHNSLLWGEDLHDVSILGPGLIWGKGLSRGNDRDTDLPKTNKPGVGNKTIALKNCRNVLLRDFSILAGGWFGILATGVDNLTIDNLKIDTNRDGMDIDCCKNVRVSNCSVNSPWDDAICPKSSFSLGYARATENVTITNCYVTGTYQLGTMLDGTWKHFAPGQEHYGTGRIKCGTESNGGFKNITISNCVFDGCNGLALESEDGALCEDITITNITMRDIRTAPLFIRLGSRMRGPKGVPVGTMKRIIISNIVCNLSSMEYPSTLSGVPDHYAEDIKISDIYFRQKGGGTADMGALQPPERAQSYPDPDMFGKLPASGFLIRHVRNLEMSNIEIATEQPDQRPAFWLNDVDGADFFRIKTPQVPGVPAFALNAVKDFRIFGSLRIKDTILPDAANEKV
jgi:polygalacturonase